MKLPWPWARCGALLSILLLFLVTWGLAGPKKLFSSGVPEWFTGKFGETFLATVPGMWVSFYSVALFETVAALLALIALVRLEFLPRRALDFTYATVVASLLIFVQLGFGMRLVADHAGAASLFFYFGATLVTLLFVRQNAEE
jgi:hypothetical protein